MGRTQYQQLAGPVLVISETVTIDKWHAPPSFPQSRKSTVPDWQTSLVEPSLFSPASIEWSTLQSLPAFILDVLNAESGQMAIRLPEEAPPLSWPFHGDVPLAVQARLPADAPFVFIETEMSLGIAWVFDSGSVLQPGRPNFFSGVLAVRPAIYFSSPVLPIPNPRPPAICFIMGADESQEYDFTEEKEEERRRSSDSSPCDPFISQDDYCGGD